MKKAFVVLALLLAAVGSWAFSFRVAVAIASDGVLVIADETEIVNETAVPIELAAGVTEQMFKFDTEDIVLLCYLSEPGTIEIQVTYLDENDQPLARRPTRILASGKFVGIRLRHPHYAPPSA